MIEKFLNRLPSDRPVALVLRHAERPELPPNSIGEEICLTEAGTNAARQLGILLGKGVLATNSSPILRCRQTAQAIIDGSNQKVPIVDSSFLGDPGVFVVDGERAFENWAEFGNMGVIRHLSTSDDVLPGMRPVKEAVKLMYDWMSGFLIGQPGLHIFVTHDAILAPFMARIMLTYEEGTYYPGFLGGIAIWHDQGKSSGFSYERLPS